MTVLGMKECVMENQAVDRACIALESQLRVCVHAAERLSPEQDGAGLLPSEASLETLFLRYLNRFFLAFC